MACVVVGTSGWHYDSWREPLFPDGIRPEDQLRYYAGQFDTTELNGVFYRMPSLEAVETWRAQTGKDFLFASKFAAELDADAEWRCSAIAAQRLQAGAGAPAVSSDSM